MDASARRTGILAAWICLASIVVWFFSFGMIAASGPLFQWTDASSYYQYVKEYPSIVPDLAKGFMIIFSLAFWVMHLSFTESMQPANRFYSKLGIAFLSLFALLSAMHYFIQISTVRIHIARDTTAGLDQFLQANPSSASLAITMLGWTVMLGLGSLFFGLSLERKGRQSVLRLFHFLNAGFALLALIGFLLPNDPLTFLAINVGVGGCITLIPILVLLYFLRMRKTG